MIRNSTINSKRFRAGFSFTEILFAVMILGIGFIMVAAMFPVAIKQTEEAVQYTTGASVGKSGCTYMSRIAPGVLTAPATGYPNGTLLLSFPPSNHTPPPVVATDGTAQSNQPGTYYPAASAAVTTPYTPSWVETSFWQRLNGNLICPTDTRYAFVPFYTRGTTNGVPWPYAQVSVIVAQCRNTPTFSTTDLLSPPSSSFPPNLQGRLVQAKFYDGTVNSPPTPDYVAFGFGLGAATPTLPLTTPKFDFEYAAGEGAYIIIADDSGLGNPISYNGCIFKLGNPYVSPAAGSNAWELAPGNDMTNLPPYFNGTTTTTVKPVGQYIWVFMVGRGYDYTLTGSSPSPVPFAGPVMDVAAFTTFIRCP